MSLSVNSEQTQSFSTIQERVNDNVSENEDTESDLDEDDTDEEEEEDDDEEDEESTRKAEQGILDTLPEGWYRGGSQPGKYRMGLDERIYRSGSASAFIQSIEVNGGDEKIGFGTVCQSFFPKDYLSKRIRLTAWLRHELPEDGKSWCGIWLKTEYPSSHGVNLYRLDNMSDRKLVGSSKNEWVSVAIVNDIDMSCVNCTFGFLLCGGGSVWADDFQFEVVEKSVPLTGVPKQKRPINLSFSKERDKGQEGSSNLPILPTV